MVLKDHLSCRRTKIYRCHFQIRWIWVSCRGSRWWVGRWTMRHEAQERGWGWSCSHGIISVAKPSGTTGMDEPSQGRGVKSEETSEGILGSSHVEGTYIGGEAREWERGVDKTQRTELEKLRKKRTWSGGKGDPSSHKAMRSNVVYNALRELEMRQWTRDS